jgi:hypothetical protein
MGEQIKIRQLLIQDWQLVRDKLDQYSWAKQIVDQYKAETDWWVTHYKDDASHIAGWGHHYFCSTCSVGLTFDKAKPNEHRCSNCNNLRQDADVQEAWYASYRSTACKEVFHAAVLYQLYQDPAYMHFIRNVLSFLSSNFTAFEVHTDPNFKGKFAGINLMDAISVIWLLNGMELVKEQFTEEELETYKTNFFFPMADFLTTAKGGTPNISSWMRAAAGMVGLFFHEHEWCRRAAYGFEGLRENLSTGLLKEGCWYESSFHYHYYTAESLTYYTVFCKLYNYSFPELTEAVEKMYLYPLRFVFPNGLLPSPNDGWPYRRFADYAQQYEWIRNVFDHPSLRFILSQCYEDSVPSSSDFSGVKPGMGDLSRLLFGTDWKAEINERMPATLPSRTSNYDADIHYALLENERATVFFKYGFVIAEHSHSDLMNYELFLENDLISRDISNSGYGMDLFRDWQRRSIAHNTVIVDQTTQPNRPAGKMLEFNAETNSCSATADDVYPGLTYTRSLQLQNDGLRDTFTVEPTGQATSATVHTFDWLFHGSGELHHQLSMTSTAPPGQSDGYQLMQNVQCFSPEANWELSWVLPDKQLTLHMQYEPGDTVYIFKGYEHRLDLMRWGVMVRRQGVSAKFEAEFGFGTGQ